MSTKEKELINAIREDVRPDEALQIAVEIIVASLRQPLSCPEQPADSLREPA